MEGGRWHALHSRCRTSRICNSDSDNPIVYNPEQERPIPPGKWNNIDPTTTNQNQNHTQNRNYTSTVSGFVLKRLTSSRLSTDRCPDSLRHPTCPLCMRNSMRSSMFTNCRRKQKAERGKHQTNTRKERTWHKRRNLSVSRKFSWLTPLLGERVHAKLGLDERRKLCSPLVFKQASLN